MAVTLKGQTAVYEGTSTDTKPTDADNNSIFKELDTGIRYYYDGTDWNEIPSSGGGGGGTGTDNYNELNNKPSINGTTLSGNKSLDNLGIQAKLTFDSAPTEDSENPVTSGGVYTALATNIQGIKVNGSTVNPDSNKVVNIAGLQTELSASNKLNPAYINYDSTHRAVSDTEKSTWNSKQNALSSIQLDAVNSGIDSTKVAQIETNENNISWNTNHGVKNLCKPDVSADREVSYTVNADNSITITCNTTVSREVRIFPNLSGLIDGESYIVSGCDGGDYSNSYGFAIRTSNGTGKVFQSDTPVEFMKTAEMVKMDLIIRSGQNWTKTFYPMIRPAEINDPTYQPYAMSNAELTATIQALQAQLANQ